MADCSSCLDKVFFDERWVYGPIVVAFILLTVEIDIGLYVIAR